MRKVLIAAGLSVAAALIAAAWQPPGPAEPGEVALHSREADLQRVSFLSAVDGDTILVHYPNEARNTPATRVRLYGIDADELHSGTPHAFQAAAALADDLKAARGVWLEQDPAALGDKYGRKLAWVWLKEGAKGQGPGSPGETGKAKRINENVALALLRDADGAPVVAIYRGKNGSDWYADELNKGRAPTK